MSLVFLETEDGYVEVVGFTENAPTLVQYAVKVGDRVLAVDSSMGERMWPVSTVEGVISAVTSRLPGQQITFRFERPGDVEVSNEPVVIRPKATASAVAPAAIKEAELLRRCRDVIKRYTVDGQPTKEKFVNKYSLPSLVADKVMDALASASATMDAITLSMVMNAYLSCRQPVKAIEAFEAAVGICADGSITIASAMITGKNDRVLGRSTKALDIYTAGSLLKAHAMNGDHSSVRRVLAALSGRDDSAIDGLEVGSWPGTGANGILKPNTRCYNIAISALADSPAANSLDLAMQIFNVMPEQGRKNVETPVKSLVTYNTMINALTNNGRYDEAVDLFYRMKRAGVTPDKFSYTSLAKAIVNMSEGDIDEFLYEMKEQGAVADSIFYNTIIKTLCEQKKINAAKKIIVEMESAGVSPDSMTYGMLMKGLIETGNPRAALTLFETACSDRKTVALTENVYLYTTAISAAATVADHQRALELLSRMNGLGISPNLKTMTALVGACLASGTPDLAYDIYKRIQTPDGYALLQGIKALGESGRVQDALSLVDGKESKILSGKQVMAAYESLLLNSLTRDDFDSARIVFRQLLKGGNIPSKAIYETIYESLNLFPKKRPGGLPPVVHLNDESAAKFEFLLFVLDSVKSRNLPCEGPLYSAILSFGSQLGALPRKMAKLLVAARSVEKESSTEKIMEESKVVSSWAELYTRYDALSSVNDLLDSPSKLPSLNVRVNTKDISKVLRAENGLSYTKRKPRRKEV
jgi:pentatricopeptide repeat protein